MATNRMLVDGIHPEETRVVVTNGNRLEEFDFESQSRRQLRGNIYLAKVTRVEPSLQAAFIEYGGNRHGFLAFSEIHPDYYQIPVADREALMREEEAEAEAELADETTESTEDAPESAAADAESADSVSEPILEGEAGADADVSEDGDHGSNIEEAPVTTEPVESIGGGDVLEDVQERRAPRQRRHQYKIQEVIKRRQVMLVQVVKEERGNKGAALTTYLSLAGRYSVLMPNTARGGGISRKITSAADRKRLKEIVSELEVPQGQGIILRTAGASRTKQEVKRDFEYLQRLWESVRTLTLNSTAPCLVYEEGSLIKRAIRDLYSKDIDELLVAGDNAYREAKDFMGMIMPNHEQNVQRYDGDQPLFSRFGVEGQLDQMFSPTVNLPSGGYLVINPTEALVSIDVNSGRSTKEHNIEDTALQTNLEAAEEVARQLRLRDLAGLIVIDFIDMMEGRSNRAVERKLKDCLKNDRARIQVGRISHFGLMEMSRQRIRFGVVESSTHKCPTCNGTGLVRSVESLALMVMRNLEDHVMKKPGQSVNVRVPVDVALYILNSKRASLSALEDKYSLAITVVADDHVGPSHFQLERGEDRLIAAPGQTTHVRVDSASIPDSVDTDAADVEEESVEAEAPARADDDERGGRRRRRRRGGRDRDDRGNGDRQQPAQVAAEAVDEPAEDAEAAEEGETVSASGEGDTNDENRRRRRRGRRGGRRNRRNGEFGDAAPQGEEATEAASASKGDVPVLDALESPPADTPDEAVTAVVEDSPATAEALPPALTEPAAVAESPAAEPATAEAESVPAAEEKPKRARRSRKATADAAPADGAATEAAPTEDAAPAEPRPKRTRRTKAAIAAEAEAAATAVESTPTAPPAEALSETVPSIAEQPAPQPESAPAPEAVASDTAPRRVRKEVPEGEIIVSSAQPEAGEEQKPKKAGWWQRRLGLG